MAAFIPEAGISLRTGEIEQMYGDRQPWHIYRDDVCHANTTGSCRTSWSPRSPGTTRTRKRRRRSSTPRQQGIELWEANKAEIIGLYPQHFAVESEEDIQFTIDYMEGPNDWFADTALLDQPWIDEEVKFYDYMVDADWIEEGFDLPRFEVIGS